MADYGVAQSYDMTRPRHAAIFPEGATTPVGTIVANDPYWALSGDTTGTTYDGYWEAGVYASGTLPSPTALASLRVGMNGVGAGKITAKPGIVLDPTTTTIAPDTKGSMMYDSGTDELKYYDGSWQIVSAGGLSAHALDSATYHTATGLTIGDVLSADSATTFSWKAQSGGAAHDMTGASHTEDATGGVGNVLRASGATSFAWATLAWGDLDFTTSSLADLTTRAHSDLSDAPADAHHVEFVSADADALIATHASDDNAHHEVFESGDFTTAFAAEDFNNLATTAHVLASADHTVSGLTAGDILSADTATTYSWKTNPAATLPIALTDLASYAQGSLIIGGNTDWEALVAGTETYVLKMGAAEPSWSTVDWTELTGSQPAPTSHGEASHTGDVIPDSNQSFAGQLAISGTSTPLIDLNPSGTGNQTIIDITPTGALGYGVSWFGTYIIGSALDPTDTGAGIVPHYVNLAGVSMINSPSMTGINIIMPSTYVGSGDIFAAEFEGDGGSVTLCADGYVFAATGDMYLNGNVYIGGNASSPKLLNNSDALEIYSGSTPTLAATFDTSQDLTLAGHITNTNHATVGSHGLDSATDTVAEWAALPVGYHAMFHSSVGTAGGAPVDNYGYFTKTANRDSAGGWSGFWVGYTANQNFIGRTATSGSFATWEQIAMLDVAVQFTGVTISSIGAGISDYDKFLVSDTGLIKYRTGAEAYADMDGYVTADFTTDFAAEDLANLATAAHASLDDAPTDAHHTEAHVLATSGPHTGTLPLTDLAAGTQGGIIRRGAADWEEYALGTETYVLKAGATDVAWDTVDWSELTGTQPAPVSHALNSHTQGSNVVFMAKGSTFTEIALGTATYLLTSGGDGADLTWTDPSTIGGGGGITGSGTNNQIVKWLAQGSTIQDSIIADDGTSLTVAGGASFANSVLIYSTEATKTDWRLTFNTNDAETTRIYNYDEGLSAYHDIGLGGTSSISAIGAMGDGTFDIYGTVSGAVTLHTGTDGRYLQMSTSYAGQTALLIHGNASGTGDLYCYSISDTYYVRLWQNAATATIDTTGTSLNLNKNTTVSGTLNVTGLLTADGMNPEGDNLDDLGTSSYTWQDLYCSTFKSRVGTAVIQLHASNNEMYLWGKQLVDFDPTSSKVRDMGTTATYIWDECYADNWNNISSWKTFADPFAVLANFGPAPDDEYAVDHSKIDDWLASRVKMYQYPDDYPDEQLRGTFTTDKDAKFVKYKKDKDGKIVTKVIDGETVQIEDETIRVKQWEYSGGHYKLKKPKKATKGKDKDKIKDKGNYADGYQDEDFEPEPAYSINKTQLVMIQAINRLKEENDEMRSRLDILEAGS